MANPTPKALHDAATQLRTQATAAQQALDARSTERENQNTPAMQKALDRMQVAETTAKQAHDHVDEAWKQHNDYREHALKLQQDAQQAAQHGDPAKAADLNRQAADTMQRADNAESRYQQATQDANAADTELTDAKNAVAEPATELQSNMLDPMDAQRQIALINQKADALDQAGRKLELAPTVDNPVERADLELDAEKLIRNAAGIQIITSEITKATGQDLQLPDVDHLPTADATPANDTNLMDPFAADDDPATTGAPAGTTPGDSTADASAAPGTDGTGVTDPVAAPSAAYDGADLAGSEVASPADDASQTLGVAGDPLGASPGDLAATPDAAPADAGGAGDGGALTAATTDAGESSPADAGESAPADAGAGFDASPSFDAPTVADDPGADAGSDFSADSVGDGGSGAGDFSTDDSTV